jgi:hypothetical protein
MKSKKFRPEGSVFQWWPGCLLLSVWKEGNATAKPGRVKRGSGHRVFSRHFSLYTAILRFCNTIRPTLFIVHPVHVHHLLAAHRPYSWSLLFSRILADATGVRAKAQRSTVSESSSYCSSTLNCARISRVNCFLARAQNLVGLHYPFTDMILTLPNPDLSVFH